MRPVICFGPDGKYVASSNYELISCDLKQDILSFLEEINKKYHSKLKILQIDFSALHQDIFLNSKRLINSPKAHVFVLNEYSEINSLDEINKIDLGNYSFKSNITKSNFTEKVIKIKNSIKQGRLYQVNLTDFIFCDDLDHNNTGLDLFFNFSQKYSGNYKSYLPLGNYEILCFSPELFLEKKERNLRSCPIKGSLQKDGNLKADLVENEKEAAELSMIVDLLRNDLNSLSSKEPAQVIKHRALLDLNYIQHTFSEIAIKTDKELPTILSKTFPGGSISGCPKLESLKLISELEEHDRGFYTGCIGWWKGSDFTLNLAIRSFAKYQKKLFYFAGCGIVYDSDPEKEWSEFLTKVGQLNVVSNY